MTDRNLSEEGGRFGGVLTEKFISGEILLRGCREK